jgi:hypothetical protein
LAEVLANEALANEALAPFQFEETLFGLKAAAEPG